MTPLEPGRVVLHRNVRRGRLGWVRPATVVSDDERGLLLWLARGTVVANEVTADGQGMRSMTFAQWLTHSYRLQVGRWQGPGVLKLLRPDAAHSVWWFRDDAGAFTSWYVNLEDPGVRWADGDLAGVDVVDQDLDIVVRPDRSWEWKDEGEFAERLAFPDDYWVTDERAVRDEGRRVVTEIESGAFPFDGTWVDFAPDPAWPVPDALPDGWDRPAAR
ncbi:DUF402 domain-containing protein [Spirilliplanes yamanashiensis]|uniref:DUF402 domain-containing protein n=1 Tax=Spirilliplanes yamanashiensis TaxID=42233 RepID=A0A8J3Y4A6_9ACTN|nr:DUF402 domain-containing protein [Spirilliplanes yamanashiensis]MDP9819707.1 hypothetical protein [Spirilliplanes yamanashiensis]GIJ01473.1 hypothetical protein Sya03_08250 [Spirilliplanes yamanashiensis]